MLPHVDVYKILPDGFQWGYWKGYRLPVTPRCPMVWTPLGTSMQWYHNTWDLRSHEVTYFWPGTWYVIHSFYTPAMDFNGCYCDIVKPNPAFRQDSPSMQYVDLYVDVVVRPDHSVYTKDEEVYARAAEAMPDLRDHRTEVFEEFAALADHARNWTGPFAIIPEHLLRADWHQLTAGDPSWQDEIRAQWPMLVDGSSHP